MSETAVERTAKTQAQRDAIEDELTVLYTCCQAAIRFMEECGNDEIGRGLLVQYHRVQKLVM